MITHGVARRYARALFELGRDTGNLEALEADLASVVAVIEENARLRDALYNPLISLEEKVALVEAVFSRRLSTTGLQFCKLMVRKRRERHLPAVLSEFRRLVHEARGILEAEVRVAKPLGDELLRSLAARLEEVSGRRVSLHVRIDPTVMGGVVLQVGDKRIDGSLTGRLVRMRQALREGVLKPGGPDGSGGYRDKGEEVNSA